MNKEINQQKIVDGRMQIGMVVDWLYVNHKQLHPMAKEIYTTIAVYSMQRYHKRSVNIEMANFLVDKKTLAKYRKILVDMKLISYKRTTAYTAYKLLEPNEIISSFKFSGEAHAETKHKLDAKELTKQVFGG